jgi:hypothetical protein
MYKLVQVETQHPNATSLGLMPLLTPKKKIEIAGDGLSAGLFGFKPLGLQ